MRALAALGVICMAMALSGGRAGSADISRLEWGQFVAESDSSTEMQSWRTVAADDGSGMKLEFQSLIAKADGSTMSAAANLSGHFDIYQPPRDTVGGYRVVLRGYIIKSKNSVARLVITAGTEHKTIEWPEGMEIAKKFETTIDGTTLAGGLLPNPFMISATAHASKSGADGAVLLSLESIHIETGSARIAAR